jgi:hypothetical protein
MTQGFAPVQKPAPMPAKVLDAKVFGKRLQECFAAIEDPRVERTRAHQLSDILTRISHKRVSRGEKEVIQPINWSWWRQTDPTRVEIPGEPVNFPIHPQIEDEKSVIQTAQRRGADSPWHCSH